MPLKPKLLLALAAVVTVAGGYMLWRAWEDAASPSEKDVYTAGSRLGIGAWPSSDKHLTFRVGDWRFFAREPSGPNDRVVYKTKSVGTFGVTIPGTVVSARPATWLARLRLKLREFVEGRNDGYTFQWRPPD